MKHERDKKETYLMQIEEHADDYLINNSNNGLNMNETK